MFEINNILKLDKEDYNNMIDNLIKAVTIICVIEILSYGTKKKDTLFAPEIIQLVIFILIGILVYYIIIKNLLKIKK